MCRCEGDILSDCPSIWREGESAQIEPAIACGEGGEDRCVGVKDLLSFYLDRRRIGRG